VLLQLGPTSFTVALNEFAIMLKSRLIKRVIGPRNVIAGITREEVRGLQRNRHHLDGHHWEICVSASSEGKTKDYNNVPSGRGICVRPNVCHKTKSSLSTLSARIAQTPSPCVLLL
jgi:hypothetical protein